MIVMVCGHADWPKVERFLNHFHERQPFTAVIGDNQLAKRWAMEHRVSFLESDPLKAINRVPRKLIAFPGDAAIIDLARSRGVRVAEIV